MYLKNGTLKMKVYFRIKLTKTTVYKFFNSYMFILLKTHS